MNNVIFVNVGEPKAYSFNDKSIETSMVKHPLSEIQVHKFTIDGDSFANFKVHGTEDAVVYTYSLDRYPLWAKYLNKDFPAGHLGENLSVDVLREEDFYLGDEYSVGTTILRVTGPRYPCVKLNFVAQDDRLQSEFENRDWPGVYFEVVQEGQIKPGDKLKLIKRVQGEVSVLDLYHAMRNKKKSKINLELMNKVLNCSVLQTKYISKVKPVE